MASEILHLVPIHCGTHGRLLPRLARDLERTFDLDVRRRRPGFDPELAYNPSRGQYDSRLLMQALLTELEKDDGRVLGVTSVDLFIPVLTWVFGEAQLDGRAAVVSWYRLDNALYGLPASDDLLYERLRKEAIHELGHTYNLLHCHNDRCVMASSTYVDGVDLKEGKFCVECRDLMRAAARA